MTHQLNDVHTVIHHNRTRIAVAPDSGCWVTPQSDWINVTIATPAHQYRIKLSLSPHQATMLGNLMIESAWKVKTDGVL